MNLTLKGVAGLFGILFVLFLASFVQDYYLVRKATPPKTVVDIQTFLEWKPRPSGAVKITVNNTVYYQMLGPAGRSLASGHSAYAFDAKGQFVGWTKDAGDFYEPRVVYAPGAIRRSIPVDEVRALIQTNALLRP